MTEAEVQYALRGNASLVVIEAPAGFGKTHQGAAYARDLLPYLDPGRLLILTHTNAACDVFASRTQGAGNRVDIRTIDSLITYIAGAYHRALELPPQVAAWARRHGGDGFNAVSDKVADMMDAAPLVPAAIARRYPYLICDEHQDASRAQHRIVLSLLRAGSVTRIFGDPMQAIYTRRREQGAWAQRWAGLQASADIVVELTTPHRWLNSAAELGQWIKVARQTLKEGRAIDLRGEWPPGLTVIRADNVARRHGQYRVSRLERAPIDRFVRAADQVLVVAATNDMVSGLRSFFGRRYPIWEGHTRDALGALAASCRDGAGAPEDIADALVKFMQLISRGFSDTNYGHILRREVAQQCSASRRGKPARIQHIARRILESPDHRGAGLALATLQTLIQGDRAFQDIKIDLHREFRDATALARFDDPEDGLAELARRRMLSRLALPPKAISTIHKAKGVERESVIIAPCDQQQFADTEGKRKLLYVAMSRATKSLALVLPCNAPSALFRV